jgi:hypothetical protein
MTSALSIITTPCQACNGTGHAPGGTNVCGECDGTGQFFHGFEIVDLPKGTKTQLVNSVLMNILLRVEEKLDRLLAESESAPAETEANAPPGPVFFSHSLPPDGMTVEDVRRAMLKLYNEGNEDE